jgi:hypothetical protein
LLYELGRHGFIGSEASNLVEIAIVIEHVRKDHRVPDRQEHQERFTGLMFTYLVPEITE